MKSTDSSKVLTIVLIAPVCSDLKELALELTTDNDHKFDLAIALDDLDIALEIARGTPYPESETKWKAVGDRALAAWRFDQAKECFENAGDSGSLLLLYLATGDREGLGKLSASAVGKGQNNIALAALLQLGDPKACVELLVKTDRIPEAALFARTYAPSQVPPTVEIWKSDLISKGRSRLADTIANPGDEPERFEEGWEEVLAREEAAGANGPDGRHPEEKEEQEISEVAEKTGDLATEEVVEDRASKTSSALNAGGAPVSPEGAADTAE